MARRTKRKISRSRLPLQRQLGLETEGHYFDLRGLFNKLNARHFGNRLRGYKVVWGRKRRERPREYFILATIQEEDRVIRINPWLEQRFPDCPLRYSGSTESRPTKLLPPRVRLAIFGGGTRFCASRTRRGASLRSAPTPSKR